MLNKLLNRTKPNESEFPELISSETPREEAKEKSEQNTGDVRKPISSLADIPLLNLGTPKRTLVWPGSAVKKDAVSPAIPKLTLTKPKIYEDEYEDDFI